MSSYAVDDYDRAALRSRLADLLLASATEASWFALVDTAFDYGTRPLVWKNGRWPVYRQGRLERLQSLSPVLLELDMSDAGSLEKAVSLLLSHCQAKPMLSFVQTRHAPDALVEAWQDALEIQAEHEAQPLLLRFADTRTLPDIAQVLKDSAWVRLSRLVDCWYYIDREGHLQALETSAPEMQPPSETPIRVGDEALAEFIRRSLPDALANALQENFPDVPTTHGAATYRWLAAACGLAEKNGIDGFPDIMALAVAAYSTGDELHEDGQLAAWVGKHAWESGQFIDALTAYVGAREG